MKLIASISAVEARSAPAVERGASFRPWLVLFGRMALFAASQAVLALVFYLAGTAGAWQAGADWWPLTATAANLIGLAALAAFFRAEGGRFSGLFRVSRTHVKSDLLAVLGLTVLMAPVSYLPNVLLGGWLFGDSAATLPLIVRPLPLWAVYSALIIFPVTQGLVELAAYFGFVEPRLEALGLARWAAVSLAALMLAFQHAAVPLLFDIRFIVWRGLMFIPFAFLVGAVLRLRPRLLPYLAVIHALMDFSFIMMFLEFAY